MKFNLALALSIANLANADLINEKKKNELAITKDSSINHHLRRSLGATAASEKTAAEVYMEDIIEEMELEGEQSQLQTRSAGIWEGLFEFQGNDGDWLGSSNAMGKDGRRYAVGAAYYGAENRGKVFLYNTEDGTKEDEITVPNQYWFGTSVALSENGNFLIAGGMGFVAMFQYDGNEWTEYGINSLISGTSLYFGWNVAMSNDGKRIAIADIKANENQSGKVHMYDYVCDGLCSWKFVAELNGDDDKENFGSGVSFSGDGKTIVVGSAYNFAGDDKKPGLARVFKEDNALNWQQIGDTLEGAEGIENFGYGVSMDDDGQRIAVGSNAAVEVYNIKPNKLKQDGVIACASVRTVLSGDGNRLIAACNGDVMVYDREIFNSEWKHTGTIPTNKSRLSLSKDGLVAGLGQINYPSYTGIAGVWKYTNLQCKDSPLEMQVETVGGSFIPFKCNGLSNGSGIYFCNDLGVVSTHCPQSCGKCMLYSCSDSDATFSYKNKMRDCKYVKGRKDKLCAKKYIAKTCRKTCEVCD